MSEAHSKASILRQSLIDPQVRKARARAAAKALHASRTPDERRAHALKMVAARQAKISHGKTNS